MKTWYASERYPYLISRHSLLVHSDALYFGLCWEMDSSQPMIVQFADVLISAPPPPPPPDAGSNRVCWGEMVIINGNVTTDAPVWPVEWTRSLEWNTHLLSSLDTFHRTTVLSFCSFRFLYLFLVLSILYIYILVVSMDLFRYLNKISRFSQCYGLKLFSLHLIPA